MRTNVFKKIFWALFLSLMFCECNTHRTCDSISVIDFTQAISQIEQVPLSRYVSTIKYVSIETNDSALIGNIHYNFAVDDSLMYLPSGNQQSTVHIFNKNGKYVKNIGTKGRAWGEFHAIRDIIPDSKLERLAVEGGGRKVVIYSLTDGRCIQDLDITNHLASMKDTSIYINGAKYTYSNINVGRMRLNKGKIYIPTANNMTLDHHIYILDYSNPSIAVDTMIKVGQSSIGIGSSSALTSNLYFYDNQLNIVNALGDTIYVLNEGRLTPKIAFNYGDIVSTANMPQIKKNDSGFAPFTDHLISKVAQIYDIQENADYIIGKIRLPKNITDPKKLKSRSHFLYDKLSKKTILLKDSEDIGCGAFTNDIDGGMPFWPSKQIGNKLYQFVDAGIFIEMSKKYNSPRMKEIAATLTDESNPVLIEATLK